MCYFQSNPKHSRYSSAMLTRKCGFLRNKWRINTSNSSSVVLDWCWPLGPMRRTVGSFKIWTNWSKQAKGSLWICNVGGGLQVLATMAWVKSVEGPICVPQSVILWLPIIWFVISHLSFDAATRNGSISVGIAEVFSPVIDARTSLTAQATSGGS